MKTPYKVWYGKKSKFDSFYWWRAKYYVKQEKTKKLSDKAETRYYLRPDKTSNGYCIWNPNKKTVTVEWNITFSKESDETQLPENLPEFHILLEANIVLVKPNPLNYQEAMKDEVAQQ